MIQYCNLNGKVLNATEAKLHISDLSILRGYGAFDYFYFSKQQPLFFDDYINRFCNSVNFLELKPDFTKDTLKEYVLELIKANGLEEGAIRLVITGGYSENSYTPAEPNFMALQYARPNYDPTMHQRGVNLLCFPHQRELPEVKTINYLTGIKVQKLLQKNKADFVLYHDENYVRESDRSNFFIVSKDNTIITPSDKILYGITRKQILEATEGVFEVEERDVHVEELNDAKEAFLSSSTKAAMPVVQIDGQVIGTGEPGEVTKKVMELFHARTQAYLEEHALNS